MINNNNGIIETCKINHEDEELSGFFTKISNYPTLRLILCKSAILVEGPTDEMIVTYYYVKTYNKHPFDDGIELISVEGVSFKHFAELATSFNKKVAIITDNDGNDYDSLLKKRGLHNLPDTIKVFTETNTLLKTLEPSFVEENNDKLQELSNILRTRKVNLDTKEDLIKFMTNNKAEWAYRLIKNINTTEFDVPKYISSSINWLLNKDEQ